MPSVPAHPFVLKTSAHGVPLEANHRPDSESANLAALGHALHAHAMRLAEVMNLGALHSVECHLCTETVCIHNPEGDDGLLIQSQAASPSPV